MYKTNNFSRLFAMLLALLIVSGSVFASVFAADSDLNYFDSGVLGDNDDSYTDTDVSEPEAEITEPGLDEPVEPELKFPNPELPKENIYADITALKSAIEEAEGRIQAAYTPASWQLLQESLAAAIHMLSAQNAVQAQINDAEFLLRLSIVSLAPRFDRTGLAAVIEEAKKQVQADYSDENWTALQTALMLAEIVYADENADQIEIDQAAENLREAIDTLGDGLISSESTPGESFESTSGETVTYLLIQAAMNRGLERIVSQVPAPGFGVVGGEWAILALARAEYVVPNGYFEGYLQRIGTHLEGLPENTDPNHVTPGWVLNPDTGRREVRLANAQSTENSRLIIALSSLGIDASNFEFNGNVYDLVSRLGNRHNATNQGMWGINQGINGPIWNLTAINSRGWNNPYVISYRDWVGGTTASNPITLNERITWVLNNRASFGNPYPGWALSGNAADPDMTAMAIMALTPYYHLRDDVRAAVDGALVELRRIQLPNGGWAGWGSQTDANVQSTAQVIVALTSLGIDPMSSEWTTADGNPVTALLSFQDDETGGFWHSGQVNLMATEQAVYALVAYWRFLTNQNSLFNMDDAFTQTTPIERQELDTAITDAENRTASDYTPASWSDMQSSLAAARQVRDDNNATQAQLDTAVNNLRSAINALVRIDRTALNTAIADAERLNAANFTSASWANMQSALSSAIQVRDNDEAAQSEIDEAANNLHGRINALIPAPPPSSANKAALNTAIADAERLNAADFTSASWQAM